MFRKALILVGATLAMLASATPSARADVDIDIDLGIGGYGHGGDYDRGYWPNRISCRQGIRIVARRYDMVRPRNCSGRTFVYVGERSGRWYLIYLNSRNGRIVDVNRIRRP
jgi:hypothetical protein